MKNIDKDLWWYVKKKNRYTAGYSKNHHTNPQIWHHTRRFIGKHLGESFDNVYSEYLKKSKHHFGRTFRSKSEVFKDQFRENYDRYTNELFYLDEDRIIKPTEYYQPRKRFPYRGYIYEYGKTKYKVNKALIRKYSYWFNGKLGEKKVSWLLEDINYISEKEYNSLVGQLKGYNENLPIPYKEEKGWRGTYHRSLFEFEDIAEKVSEKEIKYIPGTPEYKRYINDGRIKTHNKKSYEEYDEEIKWDNKWRKVVVRMKSHIGDLIITKKGDIGKIIKMTGGYFNVVPKFKCRLDNGTEWGYLCDLFENEISEYERG